MDYQDRLKQKKEYKLWKFGIPLYIILFLIIFDAILAPFLESRMISGSYYFYSALRYLCHQLPTRCIWIFGSNMGLCSRCFGIFLGLFLIGIFLGAKRINRILWKSGFILILPTIIDGITQLKGLRESDNYIRFTTGFLGGIGAGMILFPVYFRLVLWGIKIFKRGGDRGLINKRNF